MRTLVLISSLRTGGAERVTVSFLRAAAERGEDVALCTVTARGEGSLAEEVRRSGVRRHDLDARRLADPAALARLARLIRRERPTVVHAHGQDAGILAAAARLLAPTPLVITRHVLDEPRSLRRERLRARTALRALRGADAVVAVSRAVADRLVEAGVPSASIRVVPNGIDLDRFDAAVAAATPASTRRALGLEPDRLLVLLPAVLREGKGHALLLEAAGRILRSVPEARFLLAGSGPLEPRLRALAAPLGDNVRFLGHRDDVPALMAASSLVVLPSAAEALPTVLMEAAAAGRPAVATDVGGVPDVVLDGRTGVLVPPSDPEALAAAVSGLLGDGERRRALGIEARRVAEERFGMQPFVDRTLAVWRGLAAERAGR